MRVALVQPTKQLKATVSKAARGIDGQWTDLAKQAVHMKTAIAEAIEDGMNTARRTVKHGYRATEDFVDDTTHRIKRDPLRAVGLTFVAGMAVGWLIPRRRHA